MNFLKQIATGKTNEETHKALVRFGKGTFEREEIIIKKQGKNIKLLAGLDMLNPFHRFVASHCDSEVDANGTIPTKRDVDTILSSHGVNFEGMRRFGKSGKKYVFHHEFSPEKFKSFVEDLFDFYLLFNVKSGVNTVKVKKQETPKIGSLSPKFVSASVSSDAIKDVIDEFLFDAGVSIFKSANVVYTFVIDDVIVDDKMLKGDALLARLEAKRKGTLIRKITVDGKVIEKKYFFEV